MKNPLNYKVAYRAGTRRKQTRLGWLVDRVQYDIHVHVHVHHTEFPAKVNQRHKPYIVAPHDHFTFYIQQHS